MVEKEGKLIAVADMKDRSIKIVESLGRINLDNLMDEVAEAGAQTIWWSTLAAMAGKELNTAQLALERLKADRCEVCHEPEGQHVGKPGPVDRSGSERQEGSSQGRGCRIGKS